MTTAETAREADLPTGVGDASELQPQELYHTREACR